MMTADKKCFAQTKGIVIGRILMGLLFFGSGLGMLLTQGPSNVAMFFETLGLPAPIVTAWVVIIFKIVFGGLLIVGKKVELAAALLAVFTLLTIFIAHMDMSDPGLFKNLAIIGGLFYVIGVGAGDWNKACCDEGGTCKA